MIPFAEFAPDVADHNVAVLRTADNVIPLVNGYRDMKEWISITGYDGGSYNGQNSAKGAWRLIGGLALSIVVTRDSSDNPKFYVSNGSSASFEQASLAWVPSTVSSESSYFNYHEIVDWDDLLIIFGRIDTPQKIDETGLKTFGSTKTSDLGGSPPAARHAARVRSHLVIGYTYDGSTLYRNRVQWSAFGDPEGWTAGTNLSGLEDLPDGGFITSIVGGEYGLVFQEETITRLNFIGAPDVWEFDVVEEKRGCVGPGLTVKVGPDVYYLAKDGFYVLRDGQRSEPIGKGKVDETFWQEQGSTQAIRNLVQNWTAAYDATSDTVWWYVSGANAVTWKAWIYHISTGKWSVLNTGNSGLVERLVQNPIPATEKFTNQYQKDSMHVLKWDGASTFQIFDMGDTASMTAVLETGEIFDEGARTYLEQARLFADGTWSLTLITKDDELSDTEVTGSAISAEAGGNYPCDSEARYHRLRWTSSADFTKASGFAVTQSPAGEF